jgi:hypothetical protein
LFAEITDMAAHDDNAEPQLPWLLRSRLGLGILASLAAAMALTCAGLVFVVFFPLFVVILVIMVVGFCAAMISQLRRRAASAGVRAIEHPLLGPLRLAEEGDAWCGEVRLPEFARYDTAAQRDWLEQVAGVAQPRSTSGGDAIERDRDTQGDVFRLTVASRDGEEPSAAQGDAFRYLVENEAKVLEAVMRRTFSLYSKCIDNWREDWRMDPKDAEYLMPSIESPDRLRRLMRLRSVAIQEAEEGGIANVTFHFDCTWDEEHGWGVTVRKDQVV